MNCFLCSLSSTIKPKKNKLFCKTCQEKLKENVLSFNENHVFLGLVSKKEAYQAIRLRKAEPKSLYAIVSLTENPLNEEDDSIFYAFLLENSFKEINKNEAIALVENGWAEYVNDIAIKMTIKRRTLIDEVLLKANYKCHFCNTVTDSTTFIHTEKDESIVTPLNAVCACPRCRTEYREKTYFKWLNIDMKPESEKTHELTNYSKTKTFHITKETAEQLIREKMVKKVADNRLIALYDRASFRYYIQKRSENKCYYCNEKGSSIDHVIPQSKGGMTTPVNCVWCCIRCNAKKSNLSKEEFEQN